MDIFKQASDNYCDYAKYVNSFRSIPNILDGLIPVQRRLLYCSHKDVSCYRKAVKSANITGTTMARYHPHGSCYGTLVGMVNSPSNVFEGQGNFGGRGIGAAAERYTEVQMSDGSATYLDLVPYALFYENDMGNKEPEYLPTVIPYALVSGHMGIGCGVSTRIPQFTRSSLLRYATWIATGKKTRTPSLKINYWKYDMDKTILTTGRGRIVYYPKVNWEIDDDGRSVLIVSDVATIINADDRLKRKFADYIERGQIFVRNESTDKMRVVIGRGYNVRSITDAQLEEEVIKRLMCTISYYMHWISRGKAKRYGAYTALERCYAEYEKAHKKDIAARLQSLNLELKLYGIANRFVTMIMKGDNQTSICSALSLNREEYKSYSSRSISSLRDYKDQVGLSNLKSKINNLTSFTIVDRLSLL